MDSTSKEQVAMQLQQQQQLMIMSTFYILSPPPPFLQPAQFKQGS